MGDTMIKPISRTLIAAVAAAAALAGAAVPAYAQRDPAYAAARSAGKVGEKMDGYLGIVGGRDARIAAHRQRHQYQAPRGLFGTSPGDQRHDRGICADCGLPGDPGYQPGEKYQAPDGSWQTRGPGAPLRDSRCP